MSKILIIKSKNKSFRSRKGYEIIVNGKKCATSTHIGGTPERSYDTSSFDSNDSIPYVINSPVVHITKNYDINLYQVFKSDKRPQNPKRWKRSDSL